MNSRLIRLAALTAALTLTTAHAQLTMPSAGGTAPAPAAAPTAQPAPAAQPAPQQPDPLTSEFRDCIKKAREVMEAKKQDDPASVLACVTAEVKRQDGRIAGATTKAAKSLSDDEKKRLDRATAAWRGFRDANCQFYADPKAAMPAPLENGDCMLRTTVGRVMEIEQVAVGAAQRSAAAPAKK